MYPNSPIKIRNSSHPLWPYWFSLSNYDCLLDLTVEELLNEIERRLFFYHCPAFPSGRKTRDDKVWLALERGFPLISDFSSGCLQHSTSACVPINHIDILTCAEEIKRTLRDVPYQPEPIYALPMLPDQDVVVVALKLSQYNDEIVIKQMPSLLPLMRKEANMPEQTVTSVRKASEMTLAKLLRYQTIPYLDLLLYSQTHKQLNEDEWRPLNLTQGALLDLLFKETADIEQLKKTILPFYKDKVLDTEFINQLFSNIRSDKELLTRKVSAI
ncbi:DUF6387 family protein [Vibrio vulnificus]|nr:DUF6387 family protein [Vibrio vulnificus]MBN8034439.1 hypothetical protein [Vibrio vulnificus]